MLPYSFAHFMAKHHTGKRGGEALLGSSSTG
jgi:hypothetical protein